MIDAPSLRGWKHSSDVLFYKLQPQMKNLHKSLLAANQIFCWMQFAALVCQRERERERKKTVSFTPKSFVIFHTFTFTSQHA